MFPFSGIGLEQFENTCFSLLLLLHTPPPEPHTSHVTQDAS